MLCPNNKQKTKLFQSAGVSRFAYNWALGIEIENYKNGGKFMDKITQKLIEEFSLKEFQDILNLKVNIIQNQDFTWILIKFNLVVLMLNLKR